MKKHLSKLGALFCQEPYRIFFPLGMLIGMIGIGHWLFYALGWSKSYSGIFHSSIQMEGYIASFVIGFLMTAMPRFSSTHFATPREVLVSFFLILGISGFLLFQYWIAAEACFIGLLIALARFALVRIKKRPSNITPPVEFVWIPIAIFHGIVGTLILIFSQLQLAPPCIQEVGEDMAGQGFILAIVLGVGGFLVPRLMGVFGTVKPDEVCSMEERSRRMRRRISVQVVAGILLFISFWFEVQEGNRWGNALRALVIGTTLFSNRILPRPPRVPDLFVKLLWISMWMVLLGAALTVFFPSLEKEMLHFMFIGGFSLMIFSVATMVTLSHAGEGNKLREPLPILRGVALGVFLALGLRMVAIFFPNQYFKILGIAAASWIVVGFSWLCFVAPRILRIPDAEAFERSHEEAKMRVTNLKTGERQK